MDIKKILAPTDFSERSRVALDQALALGRRFGARVDVLNAWELPFNLLPDWLVQEPGRPPQPATAVVRSQAARELEHLLASLRDRYENVHGRLENGDPADVIVRVAKADAYDLIVIGTHGHSGAAHLWAGSVAEAVVRRASCPVLTVRGSAEPSAQ